MIWISWVVSGLCSFHKVFAIDKLHQIFQGKFTNYVGILGLELESERTTG